MNIAEQGVNMPRLCSHRPIRRRFLRPHSQCSALLAYLKSGKVVTTRLAVERWECYRLSERVRELKARGHRIDSAIVRIPSGKRIAVYSLSV
jgi:hypothetical protein